ncbi:MAG TPA: MgtC/SapB family protein [Hyphomicrobiaceae bacterium]
MSSDILRSHLPETTMVARMLLAIVLGAAIGFERELRSRPAGLRTHILVSMAAASFTLITIEIFYEMGNRGGTQVSPADPARIVDAVTAGVAFIAAGAIIKSQGDVKGVTTGAAIWLAGAIGVACGIGYYLLAALATGLAVLVLQGIGLLERWWLGKETDT